jgi:Protein of unknown function (DUF2442)
MLETITATADSTASVGQDLYGGKSNVPWYITLVRVLPDFKLSVEFIDGTSGTVEMRELIFSEGAGVFRALRDENVFANVAAEDGDVIWANGLDLAPDAMYDEFRRNGVWILRAKS